MEELPSRIQIERQKNGIVQRTSAMKQQNIPVKHHRAKPFLPFAKSSLLVMCLDFGVRGLASLDCLSSFHSCAPFPVRG